MPRVGAHNPIDAKCRNGHEFKTTVRREGTKCPECTTTVYIRKDGTVGYLRGNQTDPTPGRTDQKKTTIPKAKVAPSGQRRTARSRPNSVQPAEDASTPDPTNPKPVQPGTGKPDERSTVQPTSGKRKRGKPARTPYGNVY